MLRRRKVKIAIVLPKAARKARQVHLRFETGARRKGQKERTVKLEVVK